MTTKKTTKAPVAGIRKHRARHTGDFLPAREPPAGRRGPIYWLRTHLFLSVRDSVLSVLFIALGLWAIYTLLSWTVASATWFGGVEDCRANLDGACWPYIGARFGGFIYGFYPEAERWRVNVVLVVFFVGIGCIAWPGFPKRLVIGMLMLFVFPVVAGVLLIGSNLLGLEPVPTRQWGGFMVTLLVAVVGIVTSIPLAILLALGRRSDMQFIKSFCIVFIEFWRGIPVITVLFVAAYIFPLFFPEGLDIDQLLRALVGVTLSASAYLAEVVRGGLQAIGKGQYEASSSMGLPYWRTMRLVVLPQALKVSIPGIVNSFIALFKDTTLLLIVNIMDLLGMIHAGTRDPYWAAPTVPYSGYVTAALIYWVFCYGMSVYSRRTEQRIGSDSRRKID